MPISREYQQYLETELTKRKPTIFERVCNQFGSKLPIDIPLSKDTEQRMWQQIQFVGYQVKPQDVFRGAIAIGMAGLIIGMFLILLNFVLPPSQEEVARVLATVDPFDKPAGPIDVIFPMISIFGGLLLAYYWTIYLKQAVIFTRIRATADLLLSVLYMVISLRITPNFENALQFAAMNISGVIGRDLKKLIWDLSLQKYESADEALEAFAEKWKQENEEFAEAMDVLRTSSFKAEDERAKLYEEAINIILEKNTDRMKNYTQRLANPIAIINYLGITLPVLTIILFPIMTLFMSKAVPPYLLVVVYDVLLPIVVWWMINDTLMKRPISFGVRDVSAHPDAHNMGTVRVGKKTYRLWPFCLAIFVVLVSLGLYIINPLEKSSAEPVSLQKVLGGMAIVWGAVGAITAYSYFSYKGNEKIRDDVVQTENEFAEALFELGLILNTGYSVENAVEKLVRKIRNLKISMLFERALDNIRKFSHTFEKAIFDPQTGAINFYPSTMIYNIMKVMTEALKKGSKTTSNAMISVSTYMKNVYKVEQFLREMIAETTAEMQLMMSLMVPVSMGVIVGLSALLSLILFNISKFFGNLTNQAISLPIGDNSLLSVLGDIKRVMPIEWLTVVVGAYLVEVVIMVAILISTLRNGEDPIEKHKTIARGLFLGMVLFTIVGIVVFLAFRGIIGQIGGGVGG